MDAERFGRALGRGVRATGKALAEAADAAAAPPRPSARPVAKPFSAGGSRERNRATVGSGRIVSGSVTTGLRQGGKRFGQAAWAPAARAGGVLWHELTGSFFALFAIAAAVEVWRQRHELVTRQTAGAGRVWFAVAMLVVFGWFAVSSFVKARRRARR